ncbi:hypothetical protein FIM12_01605 [SAR202 cluster bacterium AD-804-J14_MRT_500m]|nr:hypothetical protein [SAR202 cluster bacterium AD-804-J14_MRT_500m]
MSYRIRRSVQAILLAIIITTIFSRSISSVHATGEGIQVLRQTTEMKTPLEITFHLEVKSDMEIKDIRLNYRNGHGGHWNYSYLEFDPDYNVAASFTLDLTGSNYIPPGSNIEFFYTITDVLSNDNLTNLTTVMVMDPRFDWRSTSVGNITLWWYDQPDRKVKKVATEFQESLVRLEKTLNFRLMTPINGIVYSTRKEADLALPYTSEFIDSNQIFHGFAFADWGAFIVAGLRDDIITHEASHIFLDKAVSRPSVTLPAWLNEGFASYMESEPISVQQFDWSRRYDKPLTSMNSVTGTPESLDYFYKKSESVVSFLFRVYGDQPFQSLISSLNDGLDLDSALVTAYGLDRIGLEAEWLATDQIADSRADKFRLGNWVFSLTSAVVLVVVVVLLVQTGFWIKQRGSDKSKSRT